MAAVAILRTIHTEGAKAAPVMHRTVGTILRHGKSLRSRPIHAHRPALSTNDGFAD